MWYIPGTIRHALLHTWPRPLPPSAYRSRNDKRPDADDSTASTGSNRHIRDTSLTHRRVRRSLVESTAYILRRMYTTYTAGVQSHVWCAA